MGGQQEEVEGIVVVKSSSIHLVVETRTTVGLGNFLMLILYLF